MKTDLLTLSKGISCAACLVVVVVIVLPTLFDYRHTPLTLPQLFGSKTEATFDLWVIGHLCFGVIVGGLTHRWICAYLGSPPEGEPRDLTSRIADIFTFATVFIAACLWESWELRMELGRLGEGIGIWKAGVEHWSNRFLSDIGCALIGAVAERRRPGLFVIGIIAGVLWAVANLLQPNAMSIQNQLLNSL